MFLLPALLCIPLAPLTPGAGSGQERAFDDEQLEPLARTYAAYASARQTAAGLGEARDALVQSLGDLMHDEEAVHPLRYAADLGRAVWLARGLSRGKHDSRAAGKIVETNFVTGSLAGAQVELAYRLPKDYDPEVGHALIVAIPDEDEPPAQHLRSHWSAPPSGFSAILVSPAMPEERAEWSEVMVAGRPGGLSHVLAAVRFASEQFAVDADRIYVAGRGKGVPAAVAAGHTSPQRFAGVIGRSGDTGDVGPENFHNLPTLFASAGTRAREFHDTLLATGIENCQLESGASEEAVWAWIAEHPRNAAPESVTLVVGQPFPTRAYWLRVAPMAPDARASARLDAATNTIHITAHGVSWVTLYLNEALIDLDRPVEIFCNGVERDLSIQRNLGDALDLLSDGTSDTGMLYVATAEIDLTGRPTASEDTSPTRDAQFAGKLAAAGHDIDALWNLHEWCASSARPRGSRTALRRILRLAPEHEAAHRALGHTLVAGHWFTSQEAAQRFTTSQDAAAATARGHVQYKSTWMHRDERGLLTKGLSRDPETGVLTSAEERKRLDGGWARQDLNWIPPEEAGHLDEGLWWVAGEWLELPRANRRHARIDSMWCIPDAEVRLWSTADRDVSLGAMLHMRHAIEDMRRVFGAQPVLPLPVTMLRDEEQYDRFAAGDPEGRTPAAHAARLHVVGSAFFAESWFPFVDGEREFRGMGVCYWDAFVPHGNLYGVHSARLAAGLSYVEALDPSPKAVRKALTRGLTPGYYAAYQAEKVFPAWLRWGAAVYAERFFEDRTLAPNADRWWARSWSLENLDGELDPLDEILAFELDPDERDASRKLMIEAGLLVAFIVDGDCAPVSEAHAELKRALAGGRSPRKSVTALTEALLEHEAQLRAFAGL